MRKEVGLERELVGLRNKCEFMEEKLRTQETLTSDMRVEGQRKRKRIEDMQQSVTELESLRHLKRHLTQQHEISSKAVESLKQEKDSLRSTMLERKAHSEHQIRILQNQLQNAKHEIQRYKLKFNEVGAFSDDSTTTEG